MSFYTGHIATPQYWLAYEARQIGYKLPERFHQMDQLEVDTVARRYQINVLLPYYGAGDLITCLEDAPRFPAAGAEWEVGISTSLQEPAEKARWEANMKWRNDCNLVDTVGAFVHTYRWLGTTAQFIAADLFTSLFYADRYFNFTLCRMLTLRKKPGEFNIEQWLQGRDKMWRTPTWKARAAEMKAAARAAMAQAFS